MEEIRIGIQQVINNLQKMEITATYNNCLQMAAALQDLANIRDRIGEIENEMKKAQASQLAVQIKDGSNLEKAEVVAVRQTEPKMCAPDGEIWPVKVIPMEEAKKDGK